MSHSIRGWLLGSLIALGAFGCGSSSDNQGGGGAGGGPGITCDDPLPRMTGSPSFDPDTIPSGQTSAVSLTVPVTRTAYRVIADMAQIAEPIPKALGLGDQAYNETGGCSVVVPLEFHDQVPPGKYFPEINSEPAPGDGGDFTFVDYGYSSFISKTNYRITVSAGDVHDSKIPIPFITVQ